MSLKAGRVGVAPDQVDEFGVIKSEATSGYTKQEADAKFETQEAAALLQPKTLALPIKYLNGSVLGTFSTVEETLSGSYGPEGAMTNKDLTEAVTSENLDISLGAITATLMRNDSRKKGDIVNVRIQFQVTTELAKDTTLFTKTNCPHPGFGSGVIVETNSGNEYPVVTWSSTNNLSVVVKSAVPTGYYALNYTYIQ